MARGPSLHLCFFWELGNNLEPRHQSTWLLSSHFRHCITETDTPSGAYGGGEHNTGDLSLTPRRLCDSRVEAGPQTVNRLVSGRSDTTSTLQESGKSEIKTPSPRLTPWYLLHRRRTLFFGKLGITLHDYGPLTHTKTRSTCPCKVESLRFPGEG